MASASASQQVRFEDSDSPAYYRRKALPPPWRISSDEDFAKILMPGLLPTMQYYEENYAPYTVAKNLKAIAPAPGHVGPLYQLTKSVVKSYHEGYMYAIRVLSCILEQVNPMCLIGQKVVYPHVWNFARLKGISNAYLFSIDLPSYSGLDFPIDGKIWNPNLGYEDSPLNVPGQHWELNQRMQRCAGTIRELVRFIRELCEHTRFDDSYHWMEVFELNDWEKKNTCVPGQFDAPALSDLLHFSDFKLHIEWYNVPGEDSASDWDESLVVSAPQDALVPADIPLPVSDASSPSEQPFRSVVSSTFYSSILLLLNFE